MCRDQILLETKLPLPLRARGKVRDIYELDDRLLFVASDRISAFDCILASGIPCKGRVLTQMSLFWFEFLKDIIASHVLTANVKEYPWKLARFRKKLEGRSMLVKKAEMIEIECVARGYLAGSGWKEYRTKGTVCGIPLPRACATANVFRSRFSLQRRRRKRATILMCRFNMSWTCWELSWPGSCAI